MLSIYKNLRTNHTYQTEKRGSFFLIIERDYFGEQWQTWGSFESRAKAQEILDKMADQMDWKYCGRQEGEP